MVLKISLVVAYILIDTNTMLHKGFNRNCRDLWFHSNTKTGQSRLLLLLLKAATLVAILLSDMVKTPVILLLCITVAQVFLKRVERLLRAAPHAQLREQELEKLHLESKAGLKQRRSSAAALARTSAGDASGSTPYVAMHG
jgi:hypothetical protein